MSIINIISITSLYLLSINFIGIKISLQEKLLEQDGHKLKPDPEFLKYFSTVVGSKWPSLAVSLSLSDSEIQEVKEGEGLSQHEHALQMLKKWVSREDATYGQLCQSLKAISLFQHL